MRSCLRFVVVVDHHFDRDILTFSNVKFNAILTFFHKFKEESIFIKHTRNIRVEDEVTILIYID